MSRPDSSTRRSVLMAMLAAGVGGVAGRAGAQGTTATPARTVFDPKLVAAAKAEGKVSLYGTSSVVALKSDAEGFEKTFGIPVTVTQLTSAPLTARVDQEIRAGRINADVVATADRYALYKWIADQQIAKLPPNRMPERTDYLAHVQTVYQGVFYNSASVTGADVPKTWNDLLNPKFAGKMVLGSPRISPAYSELYYALWKDPKYGVPFFEKLAAQKPRVVQNNPLVAQLVASGEAVVGFCGLPFDAINVKAANKAAPIEYAYLDVVTMAPTFLAINAKASNPNAAKLLASWLLSPEGQIAHNGSNRASSMLGNLPGTLVPPPRDKVRFEITAEKVSAEYQNLIALFDRLYR